MDTFFRLLKAFAMALGFSAIVFGTLVGLFLIHPILPLFLLVVVPLTISIFEEL